MSIFIIFTDIYAIPKRIFKILLRSAQNMVFPTDTTKKSKRLTIRKYSHIKYYILI